MGADYTAYFDNSSKGARLASAQREFVSDELTRGDVNMENASKAMVESKASSSRMAAAVPAWRTVPGTIAYTTPLAPGASTAVTWDYDGTDLKRGVDYEEIEFITNDPDRIFFGTQPILGITYIGGCLNDWTLFVWNTDGNQNEEKVYNYGDLADGANGEDDDFHWGDDPEDGAQFFEGSWFLAGPVAPGALQENQFYISNMYANWDDDGFAGNPNPSSGICEFDEVSDIHMGWKRTGGCPGVPAEILGGYVKSYYVDTNAYFGGTVYEAIGLEITMTEVGAYDPEYGDFAFLKWDLTERYGETEDPVYAGTWVDWDVQPNGNANHGIISDVFNGYALWDWVTPTFAYGFFDPRLFTDECGLDASQYSPRMINEMGQRCTGGAGSDGCGGYGLWQGLAADEGFEGWSHLWESVVNGPARQYPGDHQNFPSLYSEDHFGLLVNQGVSIGPNQTKSVIQAKYGIDMSDVGSAGATDVAAAEAKIAELAKRAAIWGGWARGDANMDGCVDVIDACWIGSGNQIYPDTYNGDVDLSGGAPNAADVTYLLNYVTGMGPAPLGAWRFAF